MAAGLAPLTHLVRTFLAIMAAVALALFVPAASSFAHPGVAAASDDDGGKKKDKDSKKSHKHDKSSKDDDDDEDEDSDDDSSSSKGKRLDKDDDDDSSSPKGSKSDDDDDDDEDDDADDDADDDEDSDEPSASDDPGEPIAQVTDDTSRGSVEPVQATEAAPKVDAAAAPVTSASTSGSLLASGSYLTMTDAIARARKAGAQGEVLQIDLEYDALRGFATCDVTFTSGTEYEMNAETGAVLAQKQKAPAKLALLTPLETDAKNLKAFTEIIDQVSNATGQAVLEMEMKHPKGQPGVIFEVVTADGVTSHFDATTGKPAAGA